jgi:TM2 domain-containing membrane protein YozV
MTAAICPYCRSAIEADSPEQLLCPGCGTPHHADCFAENGGCTVFGCKNAPADEQKVTLTGRDLAFPPSPIATNAPAPTIGNIPEMLPGVGLMPPGWKPNAPPQPQKAAPPPRPDGLPTPTAPPAPTSSPAYAAPSRPGVPSMFFNAQTVPAAPQITGAAPPYAPQAFDPAFQFQEAGPDAKNRSTFILLGALLGPFGAHNFYAGYYGKAIGQLCLTCLTLGFAGIMTWVWAVIEICTIDRDSKGVIFRS